MARTQPQNRGDGPEAASEDGGLPPRSHGPLSAKQLEWCRANGVALAYDPAQTGWVAADAPDDLGVGPSLDAASSSGAEADASLRFRAWTPEDVPRFTALLDDPEVWRLLPEPYPDPLTEAQAQDLIGLSNAAAHHVVRAVLVADMPVGQVRLAHEPGTEDGAEAEISYWLGRAHWGRGIGARMVAQFTETCFANRPKLQSIFARVHRENAASARLLEKAGYRSEGAAPDDPDIVVFRRHRKGPAG